MAVSRADTVNDRYDYSAIGECLRGAPKASVSDGISYFRPEVK